MCYPPCPRSSTFLHADGSGQLVRNYTLAQHLGHPWSGLGFFSRGDYKAGTRLATYGGLRLTQEELDTPGYDTAYV